MPPTILVPLDGSELAERALPVAEQLARARGARLQIVRVLSSEGDQEPDTTSREVWAQGYLAEDYVRHMAEMVRRDAGVQAEGSLVYGDAAARILDAACQYQPSLVVMATHGRSGVGRFLFGSTADAVVRNVDVPVVVIPSVHPSLASARRTRPYRILLALDESGRSQLLLEPVRQLAMDLQAEVVIVRLVDEPPASSVRIVGGAPVIHYGLERQLAVARAHLELLAGQLRSTVRDVSVRCEPGDPGRRIAQIADEEGADLIALVTRGRSGLSRFFLGSVASATLRRTQLPVLLLREAASASVSTGSAATGLDRQVSQPAEPSDVALQLTRTDLNLILDGLHALESSPPKSASVTQAIDALQARLKAATPA